MIMDGVMTIIEHGTYLITGTCYVAGVLDRDGIPGPGQVLVFNRETGVIAGSRCADPVGVYHVQVVAGSGNPIAATSDKVMIIGRDFNPVALGAYTADDISLVTV